MENKIAVLLSMCVALAVGSGPTPGSLPPDGTLPVTEAPKAPDSASGPDEFFDWLNSVGKTNESDEAGQSTTTTIPTYTTNQPRKNSTSAQKPTATTWENQDPDSFFAWLDGMKPKPTDSNTGQAFTKEQESSTNQNGESTSNNFGDKTVAPLRGTSQDHVVDLTKRMTTPTPVTTTEDEDIEWLKSMFPETHKDTVPKTEMERRNPHSEIKDSPSDREDGDRRKHTKFNLPPPDKFYEWLSSLHSDSKSDQSETSSKISPDHPVSLSTEVVIFLSVFAGVLALLVICISVYVIHRRKTPQKSKAPGDTPVKPGNEVYFSGCNDVFHGIPTNNDIWKNLDMLSVNAPSVLPDSGQKA